MLTMSFETFCADSALIWKVVGYVLMVFKIVIPLLIIILGSIDLGKAVMSGKADDIKNNAKSLGFRAAAALLIFVLPSLVVMVFNWIMEFSGTDLDFKACSTCVNSPGKCNTSGAVRFDAN